MKMVINVVVVLIGIIGLSGLADATDDFPPHHQCVQVCNIKYTPAFNKCKGVEECENFVSSQAQSCIRKCSQ